MRGLKALLIRKIVITAIFWCVPLLLFPPQWFVALGLPAPEPLLIARLLGAAYLALLVGYWAGLQGLRRGESPLPVMHMGIVSNGAAALLLLYFGSNGAWAHWSIGAQVFMWLSALGAGSIAASLLRFRKRYRATPAPSPSS